MTIKPEVAAEIVRLHHGERWPIGTIATQLGLHHSTVRRALQRAGGEVEPRKKRPSIIEPFVPFIVETFEQYPTLSAARLYEMVCERGYRGAPDHFRTLVRAYRPKRVKESYLRLSTLPGEEAQADWAQFGTLSCGRAERSLMAFVMVLSYSRHLFVQFYLDQATPNFIRGHVHAFNHYGAVPRVVLYDNLKSAVIERRAQAIRFNTQLLELAAHYRFEPRPVAPYRGNEKGRVERAIRFIRGRFFAARTYRDLDDLNAQVLAWCQQIGERPCPQANGVTVRERFEHERQHMRELPHNPFPTDECVARTVRKRPYVRFDRNDYSVPHTYRDRTLTVIADLKKLRIVDEAGEIVAEHPRSFDKGAVLEDPAHIEAHLKTKQTARQARSVDRLHLAAPNVETLFERLAIRGNALGVLTRGLVALLDTYGPAAFERAIDKALEQREPTLSTVRQLIDQDAHRRQQPPPLPIDLPEPQRLREHTVRPHSLRTYQSLLEHHDDQNDD